MHSLNGRPIALLAPISAWRKPKVTDRPVAQTVGLSKFRERVSGSD